MSDLPRPTVGDLACALGYKVVVDAGLAAPVMRASDLVVGRAAELPSRLERTAALVIGSVPAEWADSARSAGRAVLGLPGSANPADVVTAVTDYLIEGRIRAAEQAERLHHALAAVVLAGGDLPRLAEEVGTLLDAVLVICTPDGRVQACGGDVQFLNKVGLLDDTGRVRVERLTPGRQAVGEGELAMAAVIAGGIDHGRVVALHPAGTLPIAALRAVQSAATVAALAITKELAVAAVEGKFRGDYLRDVLAGRAGDAAGVIEHCAALGWDVARPLVVVVAELDPADGPTPELATATRSQQDRFASAWAQVVGARDATIPVVGFSQEIVALLPTDGDADSTVDSIVAAISGDRGGGRRSFCAGVSRVVTEPGGLAEAYSQARKAVAVGRRVRGRGSVAHFDTLGVHRLLSLVDDPHELTAFASEVLHELARDTVESADLRVTLQSLLDTNLNVAETARALHFHYNTLRYRIGKLERILGPFTTDPHLRLDVALALQVMQMRGI